MLYTKRLLENSRTARLQWDQPWPSRDPDGNLVDAYVMMTATVRDCVNMQRETVFAAGKSTMGDDRELLLDFIRTRFPREFRE